MKSCKNLVLLICILSLFPLYGCGALVAGGAAAGATYVYTEGWVEHDYDSAFDTAYYASIDAVKALGMTTTKKVKEVASAEIEATKGDTKYWIKIKEKNNNQTTISVRAGVMGDKDASRKIHEEIQTRI